MIGVKAHLGRYGHESYSYLEGREGYPWMGVLGEMVDRFISEQFRLV